MVAPNMWLNGITRENECMRRISNARSHVGGGLSGNTDYRISYRVHVTAWYGRDAWTDLLSHGVWCEGYARVGTAPWALVRGVARVGHACVYTRHRRAGTRSQRGPNPRP